MYRTTGSSLCLELVVDPLWDHVWDNWIFTVPGASCGPLMGPCMGLRSLPSRTYCPGGPPNKSRYKWSTRTHCHISCTYYLHIWFQSISATLDEISSQIVGTTILSLQQRRQDTWDRHHSTWTLTKHNYLKQWSASWYCASLYQTSWRHLKSLKS